MPESGPWVSCSPALQEDNCSEAILGGDKHHEDGVAFLHGAKPLSEGVFSETFPAEKFKTLCGGCIFERATIIAQTVQQCCEDDPAVQRGRVGRQ